MICAACGGPSGNKPFCGTCWKLCPEPTRQALRNRTATIRQVAGAINLRRQSETELHRDNVMSKRDGVHRSEGRFARVGYRRK